MGYLVDTGVLIDAERGGDVLASLPNDAPVSLSVITVSELLHGVHRASDSHRPARLAFVEAVLLRLEALPITSTIARVHAQLWAELTQSGRMIGAHDAWIAATAIAHDLSVVTGDATHFDRVTGLTVVSA